MLAQIKFAKVRPSAIIPTKLEENAGLDIYANFEEESIVIEPHQTVMIPTGIASACDKDFYFQLEERGSTGTKGIGQRCGCIDSGYRNEWFVPITNHNTKPLIITKETSTGILDILALDYIVYPYSKAICQAVVLPVPELEIEEFSYWELHQIGSQRGLGCLGASGK